MDAGAAGSGKRREVVVSGKRVKTIDVHAHCIIPEALTCWGGASPRHRRGPASRKSASGASREMDAQGIDVEVLSINPYWYKADRDTAAEVVRSTTSASPSSARHTRTASSRSASVALQFPDLAAEQLEHAVKKLGLKGAAVGASVRRRRFLAIRSSIRSGRSARSSACSSFIHPQSTPELARALEGQRLARQHDRQPARHDDRALASHLRRHARPLPELKICSAHGGGFLPSYAPRSDHACASAPDSATPSQAEEKADRVSARDLLRHARLHARSAAAPRGGSRREPAHDRHRPPDSVGAESRRSHHERRVFSDEERIAMLGGNAARLLRMDPS